MSCASGEEAYSVAMLLDHAHTLDPPSHQVLPTDIDQDAVVHARHGV